MVKKVKSIKNPELLTRKDNKALWNLPKTRRYGYRNLHKINRYGIFLRSDLVLRLKKKYKTKTGQNQLVKK